MNAILRPKFVTMRETIIPFMAISGATVIGEGDATSRTYDSPRDAVDSFRLDEYCRFIRFDLDTLTGEDVTEEMATAWLETFDRTPEDEDVLPEYVRLSKAWDAWCEDYRVEYGFTPQGSWGTYHTHNGSVA